MAQYLMAMQLPKVAKARQRHVSDSEPVDILNGIEHERLTAAILLGVLASLRLSETLSLWWEDVGFVRKVVRLRSLVS
jgi:integrase